MTWTDKQLNDAEEAVTKLTEATNLTDKEIVDVIADGFAIKYKGKLPDNIYDLIDELRATFDAY
jgi:flavodoxin